MTTGRFTKTTSGPPETRRDFRSPLLCRSLHVRGHSNEDIATVVQTEDGLVVFTHAWWTAEVPVEDPYAPDPTALHASRARILELSPTLIVPGHGPAFQPGPATPR
jgi:glyoxylase-like metal-dependent hydrolase (beta-lactamase superfamily II)